MRAASPAITAARSVGSKRAQLAISASVRPQPTHKPVLPSMAQMFLQGVSICGLTPLR